MPCSQGIDSSTAGSQAHSPPLADQCGRCSWETIRAISGSFYTSYAHSSSNCAMHVRSTATTSVCSGGAVTSHTASNSLAQLGSSHIETTWGQAEAPFLQPQYMYRETTCFHSADGTCKADLTTTCTCLCCNQLQNTLAHVGMLTHTHSPITNCK